MGVHSKEIGSSGVYTSHDKICSKVTLVPEEVLLEEGHTGDDAGFAAGGEGVEFELGGDEGSDEFGTRRGRGWLVSNKLMYVEGAEKEGKSNSAAVPAPVGGCLSVNMTLSSRYPGKPRINIPAHQMFGVI